jgi:SAM-dependent methyltransferase
MPEVHHAEGRAPFVTAENEQIYDREGTGTETLDLLESAVRYNDWVASHIRPWLGATNLEIGAGTGTITASVLDDSAFELVEPVPGLRRVLADRFADRPNVTLGAEDFFDAAGAYDCIYSSNVLEHVPDYLEFIAHGAGLLVPGGHFVAVVPSHAWLMSEFDESIGHYRRFGGREATEVRALIANRSLPLEIVRWRHFNPIGALGWLVKMRWMGQREVRPGDIRVNEWLMPVHRMLDRIDVGFGQSLSFVLRRTD